MSILTWITTNILRSKPPAVPEPKTSEMEPTQKPRAAGGTTDLVARDLRRMEGWRPYAYQDHLGYWTIGYGFLIDRNKGGSMPQDVGDLWLVRNIDAVTYALRSRLPWFEYAPLQVRRALINMAYQMGIDGLLAFRRTLELLEERRYADAADQAMQSLWARQTPARAREVTGWIREEQK
jgi:lysozyme